PFTDVASGIYYYQPVLWAVENGITSGTSATTFAPDNPCTRAQVVTFLYRALKDK
ncbi:MAG: S-layer homology domain-containing protein, partial [Oscillospiraceae bacterium]|nr:S-layer homology domain-containing protein [Oscillospiraceae bacterium]